MIITTSNFEAVEVMAVEAKDGIPGGPAAFADLERRIGSMRGRRFYAALHPDGRYQACVARRPGDDPQKLEVAETLLPGGLCARTMIVNWKDHLEEISAAFDAMAERYAVDLARPSIEYYRGGSELILYLPIHAPV